MDTTVGGAQWTECHNGALYKSKNKEREHSTGGLRNSLDGNGQTQFRTARGAVAVQTHSGNEIRMI
jgi:hypothetical protein